MRCADVDQLLSTSEPTCTYSETHGEAQGNWHPLRSGERAGGEVGVYGTVLTRHASAIANSVAATAINPTSQ